MKNIKRYEKFNRITENYSIDNKVVSMFFQEITGEDSFEYGGFKKATYEQIQELHSNASTSGVYYNNEYLIFTIEDTLKNWKYYAGYEYIDEVPNMINMNKSYMCIYDYQIHERIEEDLEKLNESV